MFSYASNPVRNLSHLSHSHTTGGGSWRAKPKPAWIKWRTGIAGNHIFIGIQPTCLKSFMKKHATSLPCWDKVNKNQMVVGTTRDQFESMTQESIRKHLGVFNNLGRVGFKLGHCSLFERDRNRRNRMNVRS